ncbi:Uncharacterised protein [Mycobacteroides abscessus subsp. abscessus]|nr:Uncharacterised protein [Mycobacteroides abscessus subsp. abscessus]
MLTAPAAPSSATTNSAIDWLIFIANSLPTLDVVLTSIPESCLSTTREPMRSIA